MQLKNTLLLPLLALPLLSASVPARSAAPDTGSVRVRILELSSTRGILGAALYSSKKGFPDKPDRAYRSKAMKMENGSPVFVFTDVPHGTYAVSILHDENGNGKMDKTFIGIPKEGFGVSNNPEIGFGPPSFKDARFELTGKEVELTVAMNYLEKMAGSDNVSTQQKDQR